MSVPKFWIENPDEETTDLFVGEICVGTFNHDSHGYRSMKDVVRLFEKIAKVIGAPVERK